jgi:hypothetical protein
MAIPIVWANDAEKKGLLMRPLKAYRAFKNGRNDVV